MVDTEQTPTQQSAKALLPQITQDSDGLSDPGLGSPDMIREPKGSPVRLKPIPRHNHSAERLKVTTGLGDVITAKRMPIVIKKANAQIPIIRKRYGSQDAKGPEPTTQLNLPKPAVGSNSARGTDVKPKEKGYNTKT